jgi:hypothetical protein
MSIHALSLFPPVFRLIASYSDPFTYQNMTLLSQEMKDLVIEEAKESQKQILKRWIDEAFFELEELPENLNQTARLDQLKQRVSSLHIETENLRALKQKIDRLRARFLKILKGSDISTLKKVAIYHFLLTANLNSTENFIQLSASIQKIVNYLTTYQDRAFVHILATEALPGLSDNKEIRGLVFERVFDHLLIRKKETPLISVAVQVLGCIPEKICRDNSQDTDPDFDLSKRESLLVKTAISCKKDCVVALLKTAFSTHHFNLIQQKRIVSHVTTNLASREDQKLLISQIMHLVPTLKDD